MDDSLRVTVCDRLQDLLNYLCSIILTERALRRDLLEQLATLAKLGHKEPVLAVFEYLIHLYDVRMVQALQRGQLALEELLLGLVHLFFLDDFDSSEFL